MRLFILSFVAVIMLSAHTVYKIDMCQLRKVIKNGWNDSNQTLNNKIIELGKKQIPKIIEKLDTPLLLDTNTGNIDTIPTFNLTRDDYTVLFAYSKYLEHTKKEGDVLSLYLKSAQGLQNINDYSMLSMVYKIVINQIIAKSLNKSIDDNFFTSNSRRLLKNKLSSSLILDNTLIINAVKHEKQVVLYYINQITLEKSPTLFNKKLYTYFIKYYISSANKEYDTLIKAIQTNTLEKKEKTFKKKLEEHRTPSRKFSMWILKNKLKLYHFLSFKSDDIEYKKLAHYMVDEVMLIETPALSRIYKDYINMVESNKKILKKLAS